jgi:hypothetical protein
LWRVRGNPHPAGVEQRTVRNRVEVVEGENQGSDALAVNSRDAVGWKKRKLALATPDLWIDLAIRPAPIPRHNVGSGVEGSFVLHAHYTQARVIQNP